jgi:hypothetical protein
MWEKMKEVVGKLLDCREKIAEYVVLAEQGFRGKTGLEKRAYVVGKINELVDIPYVPEWIEAMIIGGIVDKICNLLNLLTDHEFQTAAAALYAPAAAPKIAALLEAPNELIAQAALEKQPLDEKLNALYAAYGVKSEQPV